MRQDMRQEGSAAAVIVTYNRAGLLEKCLRSIVSQTRLPEAVYIIDNCSTDGTRDMLRQGGYVAGQEHIAVTGVGSLYRTLYNTGRGAVQISYVCKEENDGGAGGFYAGMHLAYEDGFDWLWMMDDDGYAGKDELAELMDKSLRYGLDYANALVVQVGNPALLAFGLGGYKTVADFEGREIYERRVNPFNGTFIRRSVIQKIGKIKKEMFIWGDETEYTERVNKNGFKIATVCTAVHYHPVNYSLSMSVIPGIRRYRIPCIPRSRARILYRNLGYICMTYPRSGAWKDLLMRMVASGLRFRFGELYEAVKWSCRGARDIFP